jgi:hypothetical protein
MTYSIIFWNVVSLALCSTVIIMKYKILRDKAKKRQENNVVFLAVNNSAEQPIYIEPKKPAIRLVYSRPREVQQILPLVMPSEASSPIPQA